MKVQKQQWQKCRMLHDNYKKKLSFSIILNMMKNNKIFSLHTTPRSFLLESMTGILQEYCSCSFHHE